MKYETTKKAIRNRFDKIYAVGYCAAWYLLRDLDPFAYSARAEGWACDYYYLGDGICLATGYDCGRLGAERVDYDIINEYNQRAREIEGFTDEAKEKRAELLREFIEKISK
jgi:hypothetical protein